MKWMISGVSGYGVPVGHTMCTPSVEFRGRFIHHPTAYGRILPHDEAFPFMSRVCGCLDYGKRPVAFIRLSLPRSMRRHLRAMSSAARWDCIERLDWQRGANSLLRKVRRADYFATCRAEWETYIETGRCAFHEMYEAARKRSVFCK